MHHHFHALLISVESGFKTPAFNYWKVLQIESAFTFFPPILLWARHQDHWLRVDFFFCTYSNSLLIDWFHRCFPPSSATKQHSERWRETESGLWWECETLLFLLQDFFFFSCRNLADHWGDLYFYGFDMKLLRGLSGLCLNMPALKWAWLLSLCSQCSHFSVLESADGQLTQQIGHVPPSQQIPLQWFVDLVAKS